MKRINFNKGLRMDYACVKNDKLRPEMQCIHFENGFAYATNNHILVKNRLQECSTLEEEAIEALSGKSIHKDSFVKTLSYDVIEVEESGIRAFKGAEEAFFKFAKVDYPDAESLIQQETVSGILAVPEIDIDLYSFVILDKALYGANNTKLVFNGTRAIKIFNREENVESMAILMPLGIYQ